MLTLVVEKMLVESPLFYHIIEKLIHSSCHRVSGSPSSDRSNGAAFPGSDLQLTSMTVIRYAPDLSFSVVCPEQNVKVGTALHSSVINISEALCRIRVPRWLRAAARHLLSCGLKKEWMKIDFKQNPH